MKLCSMLMKFDKSFIILMVESPHTNNHSHCIIMLPTYLFLYMYVYKNVNCAAECKSKYTWQQVDLSRHE